MPRAKWVVASLTVALLCTTVVVLQRTEGAAPAAAVTDDALPSRALGLSGHRRLVRELEQSGESDRARAPRPQGAAAGPLRTVSGPLRAARPLRLRIPSLGVDVPLGDDGEEASWDSSGPTPGAAGTAVVTGTGLRLGELRRGRTIEIPRADRRTAVFTVVRISPGRASGPPETPDRAQLRLIGGETAVLARLTGHRSSS
ncbi:class F sortase [Streptomyces sp. PCS3-D2]|uniref:class F sortase n=1 Tax=Streptomyces sp. PCS3-D2 TaxID=1460244 RepID=UPI000447115C|nr:class F sortase [Streptomyces sp. PCS3-D2]WKV72915.1 class F sortase [Streptomyces sp. PCS3-D2]